MPGLRTLVAILIAVFMSAGVIARAAPAEAAGPAPCHDTGGHHKSKPVQMAVNCCAGCLPAPADPAEAPAAPTVRAEPLRPSVSCQPEGRQTGPDPRPPRAFRS